MIQETFKDYQRALNRLRENALAEGPLLKSKSLLEPNVNYSTDISDLDIPDIPISIPEFQKKPVKEPKFNEGNSKSLF